MVYYVSIYLLNCLKLMFYIVVYVYCYFWGFCWDFWCIGDV